jgi:glutamate-1-semialdehyde 2,1-aminomutase
MEGIPMSILQTNTNEQWNERLNRTIPWGSSTCSKAPQFLPDEPAVIVKGQGCRVWDADGNVYIDYRNGLGPITLGYQFPEVDEAIRTQLGNGIIFGHPHPLEAEVAELLCEVIPCAEQARFLKTGGEALAAVIRIARTYTGRDRIVQVGYNGWVNSLGSGGLSLPSQVATGSTVPGVPAALSALHHVVRWNDLAAMEQVFTAHPGEIAAVIIAADYAAMAAGAEFYPAVRELTRKHGVLLVFDEIVTGFRMSIGGIQEYFGVTPDLAVFSKGMANGMPISAYVGSKEVMSACDRGKAVISSTFAGETLSLAASKATIQVYKSRNVIGHIWRQGETLWSGLSEKFVRYGIPMKIKGYWPCPTFSPNKDAEAGLLNSFLRESYRQGVSLYNVSYVNFSHTDADIQETLERLDEACRALSAR